MSKNKNEDKKTLVWSKSIPIPPKHNIISEKCKNYKIFRPSYEKDPKSPTSMKSLLSWEYARIWEEERDKFLQAKRKSEEKPKLKLNIFGSKRAAAKKKAAIENKASKSTKSKSVGNAEKIDKHKGNSVKNEKRIHGGDKTSIYNKSSSSDKGLDAQSDNVPMSIQSTTDALQNNQSIAEAKDM